MPTGQLRKTNLFGTDGHAQYMNFQMAEVATPLKLVEEFLRRITRLRETPPSPAEKLGENGYRPADYQLTTVIRLYRLNPLSKERHASYQ